MGKIICPTCKAIVAAPRQELPTWPFCSPRCRSVDLGGWLTDAYRISVPLSEEDLDQGPQRDDRGASRDSDEEPPS